MEGWACSRQVFDQRRHRHNGSYGDVEVVVQYLVQFGFEFGHRGLDFAFAPGDLAFEAGALGLDFAFEAGALGLDLAFELGDLAFEPGDVGFCGEMLIDAFEPRQALFWVRGGLVIVLSLGCNQSTG